MKEKEILIPDEVLLNKIYLIRGQKVMIDRDLAQLYGVETKRLKEQVKRNQDKFPEHFMFRLTEKEIDFMVSQNATPSKQQLGGAIPMVFTEHGVLQLANVINNIVAIKISIRIIELFVKMREMILTHKDLLLEMEEIRKKMSVQDERIDLVFDYLTQFITKDANEMERRKIGFKSK
ncbi:MAG: ORF6N domain-containing protein [Crocinitomicaceae bacterium]|nr:ORF6N domain-containing protein [Crocinitomicaceae bacterium]